TSLKSVQHEEYTIPANTPMIINIEGLAFLALAFAFDMELVPNQDLIFVTSITTGLKRGLKIKLTPKVQNSV
ncbi:hypothetical protein BSLG_005157, partial [Batrachochytrium salamandrivorans]